MSERITLTTTPVQITDGTNSAHVTVTDGYVEYADKADSTAWHRAERIMTICPPFKIWIKASGKEAVVILTSATG